MAIVEEKRAKWKELLPNLDEDPWDEGYRVITKKVVKRLPVLSREHLTRSVQALFPHGNEPDGEGLGANGMSAFIQERLLAATR